MVLFNVKRKKRINYLTQQRTKQFSQENELSCLMHKENE